MYQEIASDDFDRADSSSLGVDWTLLAGAFEILSNTATCDSGTGLGSVAAYDDTFDVNQWAEITLSLDGSGIDYIGVAIRISGTSISDVNCIRLQIQGTGLTTSFEIYQAGVRTFNPTGDHPPGDWANGDVARIEVEGVGAAAVIRLSKNGVVYATYSNPAGGSPSSGQAGLSGFRTNNGARAADWAAGNVVPDAYQIAWVTA